jgi:hypothetical protein
MQLIQEMQIKLLLTGSGKVSAMFERMLSKTFDMPDSS